LNFLFSWKFIDLLKIEERRRETVGIDPIDRVNEDLSADDFFGQEFFERLLVRHDVGFLLPLGEVIRKDDGVFANAEGVAIAQERSEGADFRIAFEVGEMVPLARQGRSLGLVGEDHDLHDFIIGSSNCMPSVAMPGFRMFEILMVVVGRSTGLSSGSEAGPALGADFFSGAGFSITGWASSVSFS
jgi:hypothetical protein